MKTNFLKMLILSLVVALPIDLYAQVQKPGLPPSFSAVNLKSAIALPQLKLKKLNIDKLLKEDKKFPTPLRYAIHERTAIDVRKLGNLTKLPNGNLWRYQINGENARSLSIHFKQFRIPNKAELYIYDISKEKIYGAFTSINNKPYGTFTIADFPGNGCIVEYFEPDNAAYEGELVIGSIGKAYRDILYTGSDKPTETVTSLIDINCSQGDEMQLEKHSVCRITFQEGEGGYLCSGALVNNTEFDGTPYFLTANHCISENSVAQTVVAYFNYERDQCNGTTIVSTNKTLSGAQMLATRNVSDFALLLLSETPDTSYKPYYAGWSTEDVAPNTSYSIHHPSGAVKKISTDLDSAISNPYQINWEGEDLKPNQRVSPANSHWQVVFDVGATETGSSGAPLFNANDKIIGQLHGGKKGVDYFGKFSQSWDGLLSNRALKFWLDPFNRGIKEIDGYFPEGIKPDAHFSASLQNVCIAAPVKFKDKSAFDPQSWQWIFTPGNVTFIDTTDATSKNPVIMFNEPGEYTVTLKALNEFGENTQVFDNFIISNDQIEVTYLLSANENICFNSFTGYEIQAAGAETYNWELFSEYAPEYLQLSSSEHTATLNFSDTVMIDSSLHANLMLVGQHGNCSDTLNIGLNILYPFNDFISHAYPLTKGFNGPFSNECATVQDNEPFPPIGFCYSQFSWCDDYRDGTRIVENSLWFTFKGTLSEVVAVETDGLDNQIAIYEAVSYEDIISGNPKLFSILAANDDYVDEDNSATIEKADVIPGKTYWLQVDGYGGEEGEFTITLLDSSLATINKEVMLSHYAQIYPNPATQKIVVLPDANFTETGKLFSVSIVSLEGKLVYKQNFKFSRGTIEIAADQFEKGIYLIHLESEEKTFTGKVLIQ